MAAKRRRFGLVRTLPSGRFQASFVAPSGIRQLAPTTFRTKTDADRWLSAVEADLSRGTWPRTVASGGLSSGDDGNSDCLSSSPQLGV